MYNKSHSKWCFLSKNTTVSRGLSYPFTKHFSTFSPQAPQLQKKSTLYTLYGLIPNWIYLIIEVTWIYLVFHLKWKGVRSILPLWFLPLTLALLQIALRHIFPFNMMSKMQTFSSSYCSTLHNQKEMPPSY